MRWYGQFAEDANRVADDPGFALMPVEDLLFYLTQLEDTSRHAAASRLELSKLLASLTQRIEDAKVGEGPNGGRFVWWNGVKHEVPASVVYRLIEFMWKRGFGYYGDMMAGSVWDSAVGPQTVRARVSAANKVLAKIGISCKLSANSTSQAVTMHTST